MSGPDFLRPLMQNAVFSNFENENSYSAGPGTNSDTHEDRFQRSPYTIVLEENIELRRRLERVEEEKRRLEVVVKTLQQALRLKNDAAGTTSSSDPRGREATPAR